MVAAIEMSPQYIIRLMVKDFGKVRRDRGYWLIDCIVDEQRYKLRGYRTAKGRLLRFRDEDEAVDALGEIRSDLRSLVEPIRAISEFLVLGAPKTLFEHHYIKFCEARESDRSDPISRSRVASLWGHLHRGYLDELKSAPVAALSYPDFKRWVEALFARTELGNNSVHHIVSDVRTFMRWLETMEEIGVAPKMPTVTVDEYVPDVPTIAVQERVLAAVPKHKLGIFLVRAFMGLRPSEARRANLSDYRFDESGSRDVLTIRKSKTKRFRLLPVPVQVSAWVRANHVASNVREAGTAQAPLFPNPDAPGDHRWQPTAEQRVLKKAMRVCGVDYKPNEFLRHAFGTDIANRLLGDGNSEADVSRLIMEFMGHTQISTSARYVRLATEHLGRVFGRGGDE